MDQSFILSRDDWSLHRKGHEDQMRHKEKVRQAVRSRLDDLLSEESIVLSNGSQVIRIPIRSLEEYRIRYNYEKNQHIGQGDGSSQVGDVIARSPSKEQGNGEGSEGTAGTEPGVEYIEAEVTLEEIEGMLFTQLELPHLQEVKQPRNLKYPTIRFTDIRKKGLMGNLDKKRTLLEALKRHRRQGATSFTLHPEDLRFKTWEEEIKPYSNAVIIAIMDTSGSMGAFEKYVARTFFFWMTRFLRTQYDDVELVFIAHHTEAREVTEEDFFLRGESGGTICSSAYQLALNILAERYPHASFNRYVVHFSDGDNLSSDNNRSLTLVKELLTQINFFGYGEVNQYNRYSTLMSVFQKIIHPAFRYVQIRERRQIYHALRHFFSKEGSTIG
ncbi:sporulation protein YhbH [Rubeoparvulum massiliense]|uniref:sporulation protein YhbH n=1 Tax=Rubeoparvulum massiliense TaxID=1631346 RepID=UPI00065DFB57|nr:sporulation protein YhbH [Rubeoparvulum massiliense]